MQFLPKLYAVCSSGDNIRQMAGKNGEPIYGWVDRADGMDSMVFMLNHLTEHIPPYISFHWAVKPRKLLSQQIEL